MPPPKQGKKIWVKATRDENLVKTRDQNRYKPLCNVEEECIEEEFSEEKTYIQQLHDRGRNEMSDPKDFLPAIENCHFRSNDISGLFALDQTALLVSLEPIDKVIATYLASPKNVGAKCWDLVTPYVLFPVNHFSYLNQNGTRLNCMEYDTYFRPLSIYAIEQNRGLYPADLPEVLKGIFDGLLNCFDHKLFVVVNKLSVGVTKLGGCILALIEESNPVKTLVEQVQAMGHMVSASVSTIYEEWGKSSVVGLVGLDTFTTCCKNVGEASHCRAILRVPFWLNDALKVSLISDLQLAVERGGTTYAALIDKIYIGSEGTWIWRVRKWAWDNDFGELTDVLEYKMTRAGLAYSTRSSDFLRYSRNSVQHVDGKVWGEDGSPLSNEPEKFIQMIEYVSPHFIDKVFRVICNLL